VVQCVRDAELRACAQSTARWLLLVTIARTLGVSVTLPATRSSATDLDSVAQQVTITIDASRGA
jgi:hypothetical protein